MTDKMAGVEWAAVVGTVGGGRRGTQATESNYPVATFLCP